MRMYVDSIFGALAADPPPLTLSAHPLPLSPFTHNPFLIPLYTFVIYGLTRRQG